FGDLLAQGDLAALRGAAGRLLAEIEEGAQGIVNLGGEQSHEARPAVPDNLDSSGRILSLERREDQIAPPAGRARRGRAIMPETVRIGFVGTGGIAGHHLKQLQDVPGAAIAAVCDVVAERANARAQEFGGTAYTDYRRMLEQESLDALYVCVPPFAHEDGEIRAAQKGIHLFVEKPVALDLGYGREVAAAIRAAGILSSVGYSLRYLPASEITRRYLAGRDVAMVTANRWGGLPG